jgi:hypothetical protein
LPVSKPDDGKPLVSERFHQRNEVVGLRAGVVSVLRLVGKSDPALVNCDDREVPRQRRHHQAPLVPGLWPAMD